LSGDKLSIEQATEEFLNFHNSILYTPEESLDVYKISFHYVPMFYFKQAGTGTLIPAWVFYYRYTNTATEEEYLSTTCFNAITGELIDGAI